MGEPAAGTATLPTRPLLKPWYRLSTSPGAAVLRYGSSVLEFEGSAAAEFLPHLLPLLDGTRTVDEIASCLGEPVRPAVDHALEILAERRLLTEPLRDQVPPEAARTAEFLVATDDYGRDGAAVLSALARARAAVLGAGPVADALAEALESAAVGRVARATWEGNGAEDVDLAIVAPSTAEVPLLPDWNLRALETGTVWLQVLPFDGSLAAVGPVYVPHESACYECYRLRRSANIGPVPDTGRGAYPGAPTADAVLAGLAATVALRFLGLGDGLSVGVLTAVVLARDVSWSRHVLYRVPRCPACSPAADAAAPAPWQEAEDVAA